MNFTQQKNQEFLSFLFFCAIIIMKTYIKPTVISFFIFTGIFGCSVEQSKQETPVSDDQPEVVEEPVIIKEAEMVELTKKASCTEEPCTTVEVQYPRFESIPEFNHTIEDVLSSTLSDYIMDAEGDENLDELENLFIQSYEAFLEEFPESSVPWTLEVIMTRSYSNTEFVSLKMSSYSLTGGAHPNSRVDFINLSKDKKKPLETKDLISDVNGLISVAERSFRRHYNISEQESFEDYGFTFENAQFTLPESIGLSDESLILYYNSYEIAPYAVGPTELIIPLDSVQGLIKL